MHRGLCEEAAAIFGKYIVFSKAEISVASEDWCQLGLWGADTATRLGLENGAQDKLWQVDGVYWVQVDVAGTRFEAHVQRDGAEALENLLRQQGFSECAEDAWERLEIEAGIGHVAPETTGQLLPQMLNYQATGRISFSKGCYTGQEVVARMHYRGKLKNPMYLARVDTDSPCPPGTALFRQDSDQSVGSVVSTAPADGSLLMLAVVRTDALAEGVHLGSRNGSPLAFMDLPYSLDTSSSG